MRRLKDWARRLKRDVVALWIAARDPRTPTSPRIVAATIAAYALSPIDLIPDFIPVIGYLDDLILIPLGIALAIRLIPSDLMSEYREEAARRESRPASRRAAVLIVGVWILAAIATAWFAYRFLL